MVELIVSHGGSRAVMRCVEFVRVLVADSIARWHGAFRTRWPHRVSQTKVKFIMAESNTRVKSKVKVRLVHFVTLLVRVPASWYFVEKLN